jgi:hypothetical protein
VFAVETSVEWVDVSFSLLRWGWAVLAWGPSFARADDAACISAHVEAQRLEKAGKARAARDALVTCAKPECPAVLVTECSTMLVEIEGSIPPPWC